MGFFKNLFNKFIVDDEDDYFADLELAVDLDNIEDESRGWSWDNIIKDRHLLKLSDDVQREKYIRNLVEQVSDASTQMDELAKEYNVVTDLLKDMDEIDALPKSERKELEQYVEKIVEVEGEKRQQKDTTPFMTEAQFRSAQAHAESMSQAYKDIKAAEEHRNLIKDDLNRLDGERHAATYRKNELIKDIQNYRGMVIVCVFAAVLSIIMLLVLQFGFQMDTAVGYVIVAFAVALAVTILYLKFQDAVKENERVHKSINRIILLQNTVKIRYVNNKNLLDYLYMKYNIDSSKELKKIWDLYEEEKARRDKNEENEQRFSRYQKDLLAKLSNYHLSDTHMWINNPIVLIDHKEMVEMRHSYILRRQKLRAQMDYNKRLAKEGEKELRELIKEYPKYSGEVVEMLDRYS